MVALKAPKIAAAPPQSLFIPGMVVYGKKGECCLVFKMEVYKCRGVTIIQKCLLIQAEM